MFYDLMQGSCADKKGPAFQSVREGGSFLRLSVGRIKTKYTANPFPVMITGISLCSNSHREFPVMNT